MSGIETTIMASAFLAAVIGSIKARQGKPLFAILSGVCALIAVAVAILSMLPDSETPDAKHRKALRFDRVSGEVLGAHLAETVPDGKALIVVQPEPGGAKPGSSMGKMLNGLRRGFGDRIKIVDIVAPPPTAAFRARVEDWVQSGKLTRKEVPLLMVRYEKWFDGIACARFLESYQDSVNLVVFTIAIPADFSLTGEDRPAVALFKTSVRSHRRLIENGVIDAAVIFKPNPRSWAAVDRVPKNVQDAFDLRYLLITPQNVDDVSAAQPGVFDENS